MKVYKSLYNHIINPESLFLAWGQFRRGKQHKTGVLEFERDLERHIFDLNRELENKTYRHGPYTGFYINDPKRRHVHKATIRDRVLHHALFKVLNLVFDPTFIPDSFSCRIAKGTHRGVTKVAEMLRATSLNYSRPCYVLKCDIKKFFDSIEHATLLSILRKKIKDRDLIRLLTEIVESYPRRTRICERERERERERKMLRNRSAYQQPYLPTFCQCLSE